MRFFVAKVNLDRMQLLGNGYLRPLQVRYETAKFMLPLRLGTVNAQRPAGPDRLRAHQERPRRDHELPHRQAAVRHRRAAVREAATSAISTRRCSSRAVERENMRAVFVEYAWDMGWCDPCAADPLTNKELVELGARWIGSDEAVPYRRQSGRQRLRHAAACALRRGSRSPRIWRSWKPRDRSNFQGRYVLRHPWQGQGELRRRRDNITRRCRRGFGRRRRTSPTSPAGRKPRSKPGWKRTASPRRDANNDRRFATLTPTTPPSA